MIRSAFLYLAGVLIVSTNIVAAQEAACSKAGITHAAEQVNTARITLLDLPVQDDLDVGISIEARQAIVQLKFHLGNLIVAYMRCANAIIEPPTVERDLSALQRASILEGRATKKSEYSDGPLYGHGEWLEFRAQRAADGRNLIGIAATFSIRCGSDSVLLIFARESSAWKEAARWQSKPYEEVSGAFWSFDYSISPPDQSGRWYVLVKHVSPWCTSNWRGIRYSVLRPVPGTIEPREVFASHAVIFLDGEDYGRLMTQPNLFELTFRGASIDAEIHNRRWIRRYGVSGDTVKRIQPVAESPLDFVDEWIVSPWAEAAEWSVQDRLDDLKKMHARLDQKDNFFDYVSIRRCAGPHERHEISLNNDKNEAFYFDVLGRSEFTMKDVRSTSTPDCQGTPQPIK